MLLSELFNNIHNNAVYEGAKIAWGRTGNKLVRKYRCTSGPRQGRLVSNSADCAKPMDLKKRQRMKITRKAKGTKMAAKRKRTMAHNPASIRIQKMNKKK